MMCPAKLHRCTNVAHLYAPGMHSQLDCCTHECQCLIHVHEACMNPMRTALLACCELPTLAILPHIPPVLQLLHIIKLAAPVQWQGTHMPLVGRPDIKPALLSAPPEDNTNNNAEADGAQQPLQQQDQQPVQDDQQQVEQQEGGDVAAAGVDAAPGWFQAFIPLGPLGLGAAGLLVDGDVFGDMPGMAEAPSDDDNDDDNDDE